MRWRDRVPPRRNERRTRRGFLILPKRIRGETRWLERAAWEEVYHSPVTRTYGDRRGWYAERWLD